MLDFTAFRTLTFDCYGTLIDWERGILDALAPVYADHGIDVGPGEQLEAFARHEAALEAGTYLRYTDVLAQTLRLLGAEHGFQPTDEQATAFGRSVADWPVFPDVPAALAELAERYELVVITNCDDDLFAASEARLETSFDRVVTAEQCRSYKPCTANFEAALEAIGHPRHQVLHVAQSLFHDHVPAKALGLTTVWVDRRGDQPGAGATPPAEATPDLVVPDLATLASYVP